MQLSISTKPNGNKDHGYSKSLKYKQVYTTGWQVSDTPQLHKQGFTCFIFAPLTKEAHITNYIHKFNTTYKGPVKTVEKYVSTRLNFDKDILDKGYRSKETIIGLTTTHMQDYDDKGITEAEFHKAWAASAALSKVPMWTTPSMSSTTKEPKFRILYEAQAITGNPETCIDLWDRERLLIEAEIGIKLDEKLTNSSFHSGHVKTDVLTEYNPPASSPLILDVIDRDYIQEAKEIQAVYTGSVDFDHSLMQKPERADIVNSFDNRCLLSITHKIPVPDNRGFITPAQILLETINGNKIETCSPEADSPYPNPDTWWEYDKTNLQLIGHYFKNDERAKGHMYIVEHMYIAEVPAVLIPKQCVKIGNDLYQNKLTHRLIKSVNVEMKPSGKLEKALIEFDVTTTLSIINECYYIEGSKSWGLRPNNSFGIMLPTTYEFEEFLYRLTALVDMPEKLVSSELFWELQVEKVTQTNVTFNEDQPETTTIHNGVMTYNEHRPKLNKPQYEKPEREVLDYYYDFAKRYQGTDIKLRALIITSRMFSAHPAGTRYCGWANIANSGVGKTYLNEVYERIGISKLLSDEFMPQASGLKGEDPIEYIKMRDIYIDEAGDSAPLLKFVKKSTGENGFNSRAAHGKTVKGKFNHITMTSADQIDGIGADMDKQIADRLIISTPSALGWDELEENGDIHYSNDIMAAAAEWCIYESHTELEELFHSITHEQRVKYVSERLPAKPTNSYMLSRVALGMLSSFYMEQNIKYLTDIEAEVEYRRNNPLSKRIPAILPRFYTEKETHNEIIPVSKHIKAEKRGDIWTFDQGMYVECMSGDICVSDKRVVNRYLSDSGMPSIYYEYFKSNETKQFRFLGHIKEKQHIKPVGADNNNFVITSRAAVNWGKDIEVRPSIKSMGIQDILKVHHTTYSKGHNFDRDTLTEVLIRYDELLKEESFSMPELDVTKEVSL